MVCCARRSRLRLDLLPTDFPRFGQRWAQPNCAQGAAVATLDSTINGHRALIIAETAHRIDLRNRRARPEGARSCAEAAPAAVASCASLGDGWIEYHLDARQLYVQ